MNTDEGATIRGAYEFFGLKEGDSLAMVKGAYTKLLREKGPGATDWEYVKELDRAYELIAGHLRETESTGNGAQPSVAVFSVPEGSQDISRCLKNLLMPVEEEVNSLYLGCRAAFLAILALWSVKFMVASITDEGLGRSFMHLVNLPFHEAGHLIFRLFGDFMGVFGGSLLQVLIPLVCIIAFLRQRNPFAASVALWWMGQSLVDLAPYIYDARAGQLMLLGGVTGQDAPDYHDWHNILERLGMLQCDHVLAYAAKYAGVLLILLSLAWGLTALVRQYKAVKKGPVSGPR